MAEHFSIAEVSRITGLASHTLRYYEQQFPILLGVERTRGGHRVYRKQHLETFKAILRLLKDEKVSIRKAKELLGEPQASESKSSTHLSRGDELKTSPDNTDVSRLLIMVLDRLDAICRNNDNRDRLLENLLRNQNTESNEELLEQISRCRYETRETVKLCQLVMRQRETAN